MNFVENREQEVDEVTKSKNIVAVGVATRIQIHIPSLEAIAITGVLSRNHVYPISNRKRNIEDVKNYHGPLLPFQNFDLLEDEPCEGEEL